jgi:sigma-B regulation protein RsbU (phosphoserine phosphatase)
MPPVILGAILAGAFSIVAAFRPYLKRRWIDDAPLTSRPKRQFVLDVSLVLAAGILAAGFNFFTFGFPLASAVSLLSGCIMTGGFLAVDMALALERQIIQQVAAKRKSLPVPKRLFSVTRKFSVAAMTLSLFVWVIIVLVISRDIVWISKIESTPEALMAAQLSIAYEIFFIMAVLLAMTINLIISYSKNLNLLFRNQTSVLQRVSQGDLEGWVPIATNDEFGLIAGHTNEMIEGLRHRLKLISSLKLAEEVQRNLLPQQPPEFPRTEIAAASIYCDETGGDYYDFLRLSNGNLGIVVADAADHGVGAAMQMTTARAFIIYGSRYHEDASDLLTDVNRYLVKDSRETGRFVALMFVEIDPGAASLRWIRAGHEPAMLYDPIQDQFTLLDGEGVVLGVDEHFRYSTAASIRWSPGSVLFIGTDGIHETMNESRQIFGRKRLRRLIRDNSSQPARRIQKAVLDDVQAFRGRASQLDDITLVVIKLL